MWKRYEAWLMNFVGEYLLSVLLTALLIIMAVGVVATAINFVWVLL